MRSYFRFVTSHPLPVLILAGVVALGLGSFIFRLTRNTSPDAFIPHDHPALTLKQRVDDRFQLTEPIAVGVIREPNAEGGIFDPDTLNLIQSLTKAIQDLHRVDPGDVISLATEYGVYFENDDFEFIPLMPDVPTDPEEIEALREDLLGYELYRGTLVADDQNNSAASILIRCADDQQADEIYRELRELVQDFPVNDQRLVVAGEAAVRAHMGQAVSDDALRMNFICPVVMAFLIILAYRTARATILPLCVIGGASAMALGLMSALGVPVYIVTNGIFVIIMALGVADSLHLIGQYYEEQLRLGDRDRQAIIVDACTALWYPLLVTSLTDLAGFFALYLVGVMPPIRYFGLFTCAGVLGALVYSYTVVPAGLAILPLRTSGAFLNRRETAEQDDRLDTVGRALDGLGSLTYRHRFGVVVLGLVIVAGAGWGASRLVINDARILAFKDHHPIVQAANVLNERFDGTSHLNVVLSAPEKNAMLQPEALRKIEALEAFTESLDHVGGTHSLAGWIKRAHEKANEPEADQDDDFYVIPDDWRDSQLYAQALRTSPMGHMLREVLNKDCSETNLIVRMKSSEFVHQREAIQAIQDYLDENFDDDLLTAQIAGRVNLDYHWLKLIRTSHVRSVCFSFACVLLLTGLMFRSAVAGLLCTLTVGLAVLVNYAVMGLGDIPLGVGTSMFASIAIGAGVNSPIHVLDRLRIGLRAPDADPELVFRNTLAFTGRALFFTAFVVAVGFLLLCVSEFRTLVRFGLLIGVSMIVSFLTSVTLLPAVVALFRPRFVWPNRRPE